MLTPLAQRWLDRVAKLEPGLIEPRQLRLAALELRKIVNPGAKTIALVLAELLEATAEMAEDASPDLIGAATVILEKLLTNTQGG